jgi:hypothetical protein
MARLIYGNGSPLSQLRQDYETLETLLNAQATLVQRFLYLQAQQIADSLLQHVPQVRFTLPDQVVDPVKGGLPLAVPTDQRGQSIGGVIARLRHADIRLALRQRLAELEQSAQPAVVISSKLIRHSTAIHMVNNLLPAGRSVTYAAVDGEEIPTIPVKDQLDPESAITAVTDAIAEEGQSETGRGELQVPYVPAARRFYLPQWVAFDEQDSLLVGSLKEAEADLASMERYVDLLHIAVSLAPYLVADPIYQEKRYGMLGQMINQGRALARYQTREIIRIIQHRAAANDLNRGLRLSLPFFDDQDLKMKIRTIEVIPAGRIMFVPAFVVRAVREEQAKVAQDTRLNSSTRKHLLAELCILETAFERTSEEMIR